jgi:hypothetical protein
MNDGFLVEIFDQYGDSIYTYAKQHNIQDAPPFTIAKIKWWSNSGSPLILQECGTISTTRLITFGKVYSRWLPVDDSDRMMMILTHGILPLSDLEYFIRCFDGWKRRFK